MILYLVSIVLGILMLGMVMHLGYKNRKEAALGPGGLKLSSCMSFIEKHYAVFGLALFGLFLLTRLAYLGFIPKGMHIDEIGMSYDAYSLSHYGMDRHQVHYPVYLENFGGGQSALYAYATSLLLKFFPYSTTLIRLPAVIFGMFCFLASFFLIKDIAEDLYEKSEKKCEYIHAVALAGPLFVTVTPYFLMSERWALDCNLFLSMGTVSLCFIVKAIRSRKKTMCLIAGISCGVTLYTYAISYLVLPLFFLMLFFYLVYLRKKKLSIPCLLVFCIPVGILGLPLVVFQLVNMGKIPEFTLFGIQFKRLYSYRISELSFSRAIPKLLYVVKGMIGADELSYNAFHEFGPFYLCTVPLVIYGAFMAIRDMVISIKRRASQAVAVVVFYFFSCWAVMLLHGFCYNAINHIYITFLVFAVYGLIYLGRFSGRSILISMSCIGLSFVLFSYVYFIKQNDMIPKHDFFYDMTQGEVVEYAEKHYDPEKDKTVYISYDPEEQDQQNLIASLYGKVPAPIWGQITKNLGRFHMTVPETIDPSENAIYIIGRSQQDVIDLLLSQGYKKDDTYEKDIILYKDA